MSRSVTAPVLRIAWMIGTKPATNSSAAAVGAAALTVSSADLARRAVDARVGAALLPYPLWCAFATVLSTHIWRLNR